MKELVSKLPPNCGVVSSTRSLANATESIVGFVPSSAFAYTKDVLPFATVTPESVPETYLNTTS